MLKAPHTGLPSRDVCPVFPILQPRPAVSGYPLRRFPGFAGFRFGISRCAATLQPQPEARSFMPGIIGLKN